MHSKSDSLLKLRDVLDILSIGRSTFLSGVRSGRYPKPLRISQRRVAWTLSSIQAVIDGSWVGEVA